MNFSDDQLHWHKIGSDDFKIMKHKIIIKSPLRRNFHDGLLTFAKKKRKSNHLHLQEY